MTRANLGDDQEPCLICDFVAQADPVYEDDLWFAGVLDTIPIPGWIVLGLRRHAFDPMGMSPQEADALGPLLKDITTAIQVALGSERVYVLAWGETAQHLHFLLSSRGVEIPPEHRHAEFWFHRDEYVDAEGAQDAAERIREVLLQETSSPTAEEVA